MRELNWYVAPIQNPNVETNHGALCPLHCTKSSLPPYYSTKFGLVSEKETMLRSDHWFDSVFGVATETGKQRKW